MTQDRQKGSPGFFSVLLGRGTADPSGSTQAATEKPPRKESRAPQPSQSASVQGRVYAQGRAPYAAGASAPHRSSMARDRVRTHARKDGSAPRAHSTAEAAGGNHDASLTVRSKTDTRPPVSSMRLPHKDTFVDAKESQEGQGGTSSQARHSRKVSFNTPTSSLRKGKIGASRLDEAGSSQDSFFSPSASRPMSKSTKPKYTRDASSRAEMEERNWNSSTATLQNKDEPRSQSIKHRRSKGSSYPLATDPYGDSFQAVRVSGPDRVVIVPVAPSSAEDEFGPEKRYLPAAASAPAPALRRPGPGPLVPHASASKRASQDASRRKSRDVQRSQPHRTRSSHDADASAAKESGRSRSRLDKVAPRTSTSTGPFPEPVGTAVLSQNMARERNGDRIQRNSYRGSNPLQYDITTMPMFHERPSNARMKA
ncbi:uncharacterized protein UTRI_03258 [Ustilago trichophora]|uniref:Uncharacterized protein n=1 Tax=Ustilago trichophora TaxID=86804 RepID=A0A5C3E5C8_9BASI|nr:uncharacterized protein UTRI_03258 [Ustilago trichophora]